ncbi:MAG: DUF364 domain-containing protein [Winkia neuii]|uniref:Heavy-metal chelation domain-containing protein n=1 Tax=Winkia neuii TaxID=33007 RepID=A0A2I1IP71_9ACTO|nr:DUF364 domain-containing protein [Winkia neuii]OFK01449.1 hypothetical protein HMPREF2835_09460 [Actinomyces sp. HMSC072A03]OFT55443.1 hypothetical protein HMPREF3152_05055 [Actinomyces sp. HMSC06A08]KWZ72951.1 hypothetical protein HMPREF3198_01305 [Winkia neuii]MDK8100210.1 DUF364 domain-containing protein [Winkia neuii]MDU3135422.1 DUF364 domain-containing protein [Winkia neuii]
MNPFALYDDLISQIPLEAVVHEAICNNTAYVAADTGVGIAAALGAFQPPTLAGIPLREVAHLAKSWDLAKASLGVAALNAYFNQIPAKSTASVFDTAASSLEGKKVVMVGHFPNAVEKLRQICALTVLERSPRPGDLPDSACEYVMPQAEVALITAMTLANKTMPRLLQLSNQARTYLIGPSLPCAPKVFAGKANVLAGSAVVDAKWIREQVKQGKPVSKLKPALAAFEMEL